MCLLFSFLDPSHEPPRSRSSCGPRLPACFCRGVARGRRGGARVQTGVDHCRRRRARTADRPLPAPASRGRRRGSVADSACDALQRRCDHPSARGGPSRCDAAVRTCRRRRRDAAGRGARRPSPDDRVRHGRNELRHLLPLPLRSDAACGRSARSPVFPCGCRWWTSTPSAQAAVRSRGPTPEVRCGSDREARAPSGAPRPTGAAVPRATVTDANLVLGFLPADSPISDDLRARRRRQRPPRSSGWPARSGTDRLRRGPGRGRVRRRRRMRSSRRFASYRSSKGRIRLRQR